MADQDSTKDIKLLKKTRISVFVDEALPDILVVTFDYGVKYFKGVLLDSAKRNLPCGVPNINPAFNIPTKNPDDDTLYAVNQRFAYTDPSAARKKNVHMPSKYKNNKMTVRLRPRQVLCSKCKGICNENSENVSRKRKTSEGKDGVASTSPVPKRSCDAPVTRSVNIISKISKRTLRPREPTLVPRLTRLTFQEEDLVGNEPNVDANSNKKLLGSAQQHENSHDPTKKHSSDHSSDGCNADEADALSPKAAKRILRKKRSVSSAEERWEEAGCQEDSNKNNNQTCHSSNPDSPSSEQPISANSVSTTNTRTIKISYGPQGEGTVLKIPAQIDSSRNGDDSEENVNIEQQGNSIREPDNKAARRALKRAKKEARRKVLLAGASPIYLGSASPRYTIGSASPRQGLGNNSPRYMCTPYELTVPRRRKHKMKHKKKHREDKDRKHREGEVSSTQDDSKDHCITQKLSINLKRLHNKYTSCSLSDKADDNTSSSDEHGELAPDFPPPNPPLMLRINAQTVSSALGADGVRLLVGDVVWGKIHGFPWWPGKILAMTGSGGTQGPQAHVAWYGSSTSSLMQCDQLSHYLDNFKIRHNKKKKKVPTKKPSNKQPPRRERMLRTGCGSRWVTPPLTISFKLCPLLWRHLERSTLFRRSPSTIN